MPNNGQKTDNDASTLHFVRDEMSENLDLFHHDLPERHRFGLAFHNPVDPQPIGITAFPGVSDTPAREDHVHATSSVGVAYWASRCVGSVAISTSAESPIPISAATMSSGFVLSGNGVQCQVAGKYMATFVLMATFTQTSGGPIWAGIQQLRGASVIATWDNIQSGFSPSNPYVQVVAVGEFDLQVGDVLYAIVQAPIAGTTTGAQSSFLISPMTGPPGPVGPVGPDVTLLQSSYWAGTFLNPTGVLGNDVQVNVQWLTQSANNITLVSNQNIFVSQAGRYHVIAVLGYQNGGTAAAYTRALISRYNNAGALQEQRNTVGNAIPVGGYGQAVIDCLFTCAAGDYFAISGAAAGGTAQFHNASGCTVTPVGGTKGDIGPSGGPVPTGGTVNQIIVKNTATNFDVQWQDQPGVVAYKFGTVPGLTIGTTPIVLITLSNVPLKAGRLYRATYFARALNNSTTGLRFQFSTAPTGGTGWSMDAYTIGNGAYQNINLPSLGTVGSDGVYTLAIQVVAQAAVGAQIWTDIGGYLMIEDTGPNRGLQ